MKSRLRRVIEWTRLGDQALLDLRLRDLKLKIHGSLLERRIERLYEELERRDLRFHPHCWLSEEWFSPDGIPGIGIPFYLAHPRLVRLEARQMFDVEGGTDAWFMQLLRHEAGHAICTAFQLHRRKHWRQLFGRFTKAYPREYIPRPESRNFVLHLDWWYAQSHPAEDFAETFAVWLRPRSNWRNQYVGWPVLRKLEYVDDLMRSIARTRPHVHSREQVEPLRSNRRTLRQHYDEKREAYGVDVPEVYDGDLRRLFPDDPSVGGRRRSAGAFLRQVQSEVCRLCARGTGEHPYVFAQIMQEMIQRCR
ncbi:MAG: putative zinc-binding metallopeptidase, partial [Gammaproteobacteria bacterium]